MRGRLAACLLLAGCQILPLSDRLETGPGAEIAAVDVGLGGVVRDSAGHAVPGARVRAFRPTVTLAGRQAPAAAEAVTGADGSFAIAEPPRGMLAIEAVEGGRLARLPVVNFADGLRAVDLGSLVLSAPGALAGQVAAPAGTPLLGTEIELIGTDRIGLTDESGAFALRDLPAGAYRLRARRPRLVSPLSDVVAVGAGARTAAPILTLAPDAPALSKVVPPNGGPGSVIELFGRNFGSAPGEQVMAAFGNLQVAADRLSDTGARVVVPDLARSGPVALIRDGVPSAPIAFQVVATVALDPSYAAVRPGARVAFEAAAIDTEGVEVPGPALVYSGAEPGWAQAPGAGFFRIVAAAGKIQASMWLAAGDRSLSTMLGDGVHGDSGDGGPASAARIGTPTAIASGPDGTLYIVDAAARTLRAVNPDGTVRTVLVGLQAPGSVAAGKDGAIYLIQGLSDGTKTLSRYAGAQLETVAEGSMVAVAAAPDGRIVMATETAAYELGKTGGVVAEGLEAVRAVAFGPDGSLFAASRTGIVWRVVDGHGVRIAGGGGDRAPDAPALEAGLGRITGLAAAGGDLYFVDQAAHTLRVLTAQGRVVTVAGDGFHGLGAFGRFNGDGLALGASLSLPDGLCTMPSGDLAIADSANRRIRILRR